MAVIISAVRAVYGLTQVVFCLISLLAYYSSKDFYEVESAESYSWDEWCKFNFYDAFLFWCKCWIFHCCVPFYNIPILRFALKIGIKITRT